jgi:small subunit ribosomal protein S16
LLKIRLSRTGKKAQPSFRIVVQEHTASIKGKFVEMIGFYRPAVVPKEFKVDMEKVKFWISKGAKPSPTMANLLKKNGMEGMDQYLTAPNKKRKKKGEEAEQKPAAPAAAAAAPKPEQAPAAKPAEPKAEPPAAAAPQAESKPEPAAAEPAAAEPAPAAPEAPATPTEPSK